VERGGWISRMEWGEDRWIGEVARAREGQVGCGRISKGDKSRRT
jgi:hypothetical protein